MGGFAGKAATVSLTVGLLAGVAGCGGDAQTELVVSSVEADATPTAAPAQTPTAVRPQPPLTPAPTPIPTTGAPPPTAPAATPEPTQIPNRSVEEFLASLPRDLPQSLAEEFENLVEISEEWNPDSQISIAVVLPDETLHGYNAIVSRISASAAKPLWTAAALEEAGVEAVRPLAYSALILSDNLAGGQMIDLAGGVDAVNAWTWDVAELTDTRLEAWRFDNPDRVAGDFRPENPLGNRTTMADLALFFVRLNNGELLDADSTAALQQWLVDTSHTLYSPRDLDGILLARLPPQVAELSLHKAGWLRPGCCPAEYRQMIDAGAVVLADGSWFGLAIMSARGEFYDLTNQWVALASCRIYAVVAEDPDLECEREDDGVHDPEIWPEAESQE